MTKYDVLTNQFEHPGLNLKNVWLASAKFICLNQELLHYINKQAMVNLIEKNDRDKRLGTGKEKDIFLPKALKELLVL